MALSAAVLSVIAAADDVRDAENRLDALKADKQVLQDKIQSANTQIQQAQDNAAAARLALKAAVAAL